MVDENMDTMFDNYYENLFRMYNRAFPVVRRTTSGEDTRDAEWLTPAVKACLKKKSRIYRMYIRGQIHKESYTFYANKVTTLLTKVKRLYYFKLFLRDPKNSTKTWLYINRIIGSTKRGTMVKLTVRGVTLTGAEMANYANEYFVSIANKLTEGIQDNGPYIFLTENNPNTFVMIPTDVLEVLKIIHGLKNKGNVILDISVRTIKNNSHIFAVHIVSLYSCSILKCMFPNTLKVAKVIPSHKSGPYDVIDNFRPISNLPVFSKIFEKLTHIRMISFIDKYKLLSESQFGFRKGKSTSLAAMKLTTMIVKAYHAKDYAVCFFLDLRKAFDTIDHDILLEKMSHIGFRGFGSQYFKSYLTGRKQYLQIDEFKSAECLITKGVPQGSILGPLLFCLYINDIVKAVDTEVVLFADDAAFFLTSPSLDALYDKIKKLFSDLHRYLRANKLIPNLTKSKLMYFDSKPVPELPGIAFDDQIIEWVEEYKYLGLTLTSKMSFAIHINNVVKRISRFVGTFHCLKAFVPKPVLKLLYSSFVLPHLLLHIEIWGASPAVHMSRLDIKINTLLRTILGVRYIEGRPSLDTTLMYKQLGILKIKSIFKYRLFCFLISLLNGSRPEFYDLLLAPALSVHGYGTRHRNFRVPLVSCEIERRALSYQLIRLFEDVPSQYIDLTNSANMLLRNFKKYVLLEQ